MQYKRPEVAFGLGMCHPALRALLVELNAWSVREDLPEPFVVRLWATEEEQRAIYKLAADKPVRFSYHFVGCAVDLGVRDYNEQQRGRVVDFLRTNWPPPRYDVIDQLHGTGPHIHVEVNARELAHGWAVNKEKPDA